MNRRTITSLLASAVAALALGGATAQEATPNPASAALPAPLPPSPPTHVYATTRVVLQTTVGKIVIAVETERAPVTATNFLRYVTEKRLDGTNFYRALNLAPGIGLIQGGVRGDPKRSLKPIAHEPTSKTGILHTDGTISMARAAPGTATGDFFILAGDIPSLNAQPDSYPAGKDPGFAAFGHVVEGMDVVQKILAAPVSPTAGTGAMKGQMIVAPVRILTAKRLG
ncbi:peptidylprolyl isomerase [Sphingosinicellaceae bacterium]|nr:peptidylprolyl isomerase [Sphingosinicellaceae bacterium]